MHETLCYFSYMNCFEIIISSQQCGQLASDDLQCDNCRSIASRQFPIRRVTLSSTWLPLAAILLLSVKSPLCWHQTPSSRHFFGKFVNFDQVQVFFDFNDSFWPAHEIYLTAPHHEWHVEQIITQKMSWSNLKNFKHRYYEFSDWVYFKTACHCLSHRGQRSQDIMHFLKLKITGTVKTCLALDF